METSSAVVFGMSTFIRNLGHQMVFHHVLGNVAAILGKKTKRGRDGENTMLLALVFELILAPALKKRS